MKQGSFLLLILFIAACTSGSRANAFSKNCEGYFNSNSYMSDTELIQKANKIMIPSKIETKDIDTLVGYLKKIFSCTYTTEQIADIKEEVKEENNKKIFENGFLTDKNELKVADLFRAFSRFIYSAQVQKEAQKNNQQVEEIFSCMHIYRRDTMLRTTMEYAPWSHQKLLKTDNKFAFHVIIERILGGEKRAIIEMVENIIGCKYNFVERNRITSFLKNNKDFVKHTQEMLKDTSLSLMFIGSLLSSHFGRIFDI